jgi:hypothetical protein
MSKMKSGAQEINKNIFPESRTSFIFFIENLKGFIFSFELK